MTTSLPDRTVSRRTALFGLGAGGLALTALAHQGMAQDATPAATPVSRIGHPLVGAWQWLDWTSSQSDLGIGVFHPDGTYLTYESFNGVGIGFWRARDERTADLVVTYQILAGTWQTLAGPEELFEPDYVPTGHAFETDQIITVTWRISVDEALSTFTGGGRLFVRDAAGVVGYTEPTSGHAVKLVVATEAATPLA